MKHISKYDGVGGSTMLLTLTNDKLAEMLLRHPKGTPVVISVDGFHVEVTAQNIHLELHSDRTTVWAQDDVIVIGATTDRC